MHKKLQVFISSTFTDLQEERQIAVEAVLNSGHIPAGMELFKSGNTSQKEVIKKWIDESDIYMLILGGRYGSIDKESGKSYTHWEYEYASEIGKPLFAIVIQEEALEKKVKEFGSDAIEKENYPLYKIFRTQVLEKISKFFSEKKDIKIVVYESLKELEKEELTGWVSGKDFTHVKSLQEENYQLLKENVKLKEDLAHLLTVKKERETINGSSFEEIEKYLKSAKLKIPKDIFRDKDVEGKSISSYDLFVTCNDKFAVGISNYSVMSKLDQFLFFDLAPILMTYELVEKIKMPKQIQRIQTSKHGLKFLRATL